MALNFADLFEHAADAFGERTAVACGDRQVTYAELDERTNRLAHHLAGLGVGPGDHVGLYARNSIEALETLIASCKLRASAVNINYRYVENELHYMFADADLTALVYDRRLAPLVAAGAHAAPGLRGLVEIDDGSEANPKTTATDYNTALKAAAPDRDFPPRSNDDVYIIYTGGTTGYPKGVMWRHEDIWRTLGGGIDFITGEPLPDEWAQSRKGLEAGEFVKLCAAPLIHGNAQVAALAGLFAGETIVLLPAFDPNEIWRAIAKHQVNVLVIIGDAMARPLVEAYAQGDYDASSLVAVSSSAALFSPAVKDACAKALPDAVITEAIGSTETGFAGISFVSPGEPHRGGPTVMAGPDVIVLGDDGLAAPGQVGRLARGGHVPLGYYKDPARTAAMFAEVDGKRYAIPGDMARVEDDGTADPARPRQHVREHRRREGLPRRGRGRAQVAPRRVRRAGHRRARRTARPAGRRAHPTKTGRRPRPRRAAGARPPADRRVQGAAQHLAGRGHPAYRVRQGRLRLGPRVRRDPRARPGPRIRRPLVQYPEVSATVRTPLCDLFGLEHPIVGFSPSEHVAAAVSRAGGLGVLGAVRFNDPAELDKTLDWMDAHTDGRPYGIDVVMPARVPTEGAAKDLDELIPEQHKDFVQDTLLKLGVPPLPDDAQAADGVLGWLHSIARQHVEVALAHPARLIANALGPPPPDVIASAHERGMLVAALAGTAEHARRQVASGVDIVVAQGYEAGGHTGEIGSMVLIPEVVDAVQAQATVLAAGGIGCGRQIAAALALGAAGVWMGSAWLATEEYATTTNAPAVTEAVLAATSSDTVRSRIYSGKPARLLKNRWTDAWEQPGAPEPLGMPLQNLLVSEAHQRLIRSGRPEVVPMPAGQIVGRITEVRPVAAVMADLIKEAHQTLEKLNNLR